MCQCVCRKWGLQRDSCAGSWVGRLPTTSPGQGARFFVPLSPSRAERSLGTLSYVAVVERVPQELGDARTVTMATAAPGKPEVGVWKGPSPMQMLPGEKRPLGPPAHPPGFVTRSPSLQRQNNTRGLWTGRRGITISAHPHSCFTGQRGQRQG